MLLLLILLHLFVHVLLCFYLVFLLLMLMIHSVVFWVIHIVKILHLTLGCRWGYWLSSGDFFSGNYIMRGVLRWCGYDHVDWDAVDGLALHTIWGWSHLVCVFLVALLSHILYVFINFAP